MSTLVVDTDVVSYLIKRDSRAELYRPHLSNNTLVLSFMTLAELDRWMLEHHWGAARIKATEHYLSNFITYPYDRDLCRKWAEVVVTARRKGRPIQPGDAWIGATALLHGLTLVTHNRRHYDNVDGLQVISEAPS